MPWPRNQTYGAATTKAASQSESAAAPFPARSCQRGTGREEQRLEASAVALARDRVGRGEKREQRSHRHGHLERDADRLALLDEVDGLVGRDQVGGRAQEHAVGDEQREPATAQPQVGELAAGDDRPAAHADTTSMNASLSRPPSSENSATGSPAPSSAARAAAAASGPASAGVNSIATSPGRPPAHRASRADRVDPGQHADCVVAPPRIGAKARAPRGGRATDDLGDRPEGRDPAAVQDQDVAADLLHLVEQMGRDQHRHPPLRGHPPDHVEHVALPLRVEAQGRLVEEDDHRVVHERAGDAEPLAHAAAVGLDEAVAALAEADLGQEPAGGGRCIGLRTAVQAGVVGEVLSAGLPGGVAGALGQNADPAADVPLSRAGDPRHREAARRREENCRQHPDGGGLAGAVRAEHAQDAAFAEREAEPVHGDDGPVGARQPLCLDGRHGPTLPRLR